MQFRRRSTGRTGGPARASRTVTALSTAAVVAAALAIALPASAAMSSTFTPGEGTGKAWCPGYSGVNLGSYKDVFACAPKNKKAGKTPFDDSYAGFQCTELANRFLYSMTGHVLFANEEGGNYVALASAAFAIPDASSGTAGRLPAAGDIISMWGGRSRQKQNGGRTEVALVTKVIATSSGWTITTLNQGGDPSDTNGQRGFGTITVSANGTTWSALNGFYASFDWLKLVSDGGGSGGGGAGGGGTGSATWTATEAPVSSSVQTGQLLAVACSSATACTAVGATGSTAMLVYRAGRKWKAAIVPVPSSSATGTVLTTVTCPSASTCVAGGEYHSSDGQQGMLLAGHGASWTATRAPLPPSAATRPHVIIASVACSSPSACVAAGQYRGSSGSDYGLLVIGHDSAWEAYRAPLPPDAASTPFARLTSVSCVAGGSCVAVGNYIDTAGNEQGFVVTGSGSAWSSYRAALPASAVTPGAALTAVTCPTATQCVAAGSFSANQRGMVLTGWGSTWKAASTTLPSGTAAKPAATFRQIVCTSATACVAVGSYSAGGEGRQGLVVSGHGSSWTAATALLPAGAAANQGTPGAGLISVACASSSSCVAVGDYTDTAGDARVLLLTWQGSAWAAAKGPLPANNRTVGSQAQGSLGPPGLASVACPSAATCIAVGTYPAHKPGMEGLVETGHL